VELKFNISVQVRRLPRKNIGDDHFAAHPVGGYEHHGGKNQEKSFRVISNLAK